MSEILRLEAIERIYHQKPHNFVILDKADYTLSKGEMVAILAPSGTGKTTLLQIAGLLEAPDRGEVWIEQKKTSCLTDKERTFIRRDKIGFIYQLHHLLPEFSALENVMMPLLIKGYKKAYAKERAFYLLEAMFLGERVNNRPAELSGGEQQRVAIARALANEPILLLADEPTGNLDPETAEDIFHLLLTLVKETNMSTLIATHDKYLANKMDQSITLKKGKILPL